MENKWKESEDIIDKDLHEEFEDEEMYELVTQARLETLQRAREEREREKERPKRRFPKWIFWVIAFAMMFNIVALLPQTFSIPAVDFLIASAKLSTQDDIKAYKKSVVVIETENSKGTGFSMNEDGTIITNYHVIEGNDTVTVAFPDEGLFVGKVVSTYPEVDLAVLELDTNEKLPHLNIADRFHLDPDEQIYFIGNPLQFQGIANEGTVIDYVNVQSKELPVVMMNAPVYRGNSGSPVINEKGEVIGVVFATLHHEDEGRVGLFIPIDYFYEKYNEGD